MLANAIIMLAVLFLLVGLNFRAGGANVILDGIFASGHLSKKILPPLVLMFFIAGQADVFVQRYMEILRIWLAGQKGILGSWTAGLLVPGGMSFFPIVQKMWEDGLNRGPLLMFLLAVQMLNWQTLMFRIPLLGPKLAGILYAVTAVTNFVLLFIFLFLARFKFIN
jgi:uncharacterized membrane protein YraQ (UPF0718 family)